MAAHPNNLDRPENAGRPLRSIPRVSVLFSFQFIVVKKSKKLHYLKVVEPLVICLKKIGHFISFLHLFSHPSEDFCEEFYGRLQDGEYGDLQFAYLKPILLGKIFYTPDNPVTRKIIQKVRKTFALTFFFLKGEGNLDFCFSCL